jgi:hypothetical protein
MDYFKNNINYILGLVFSSLLLAGSLEAQDLEPRFLSPAPVGMNFALLGYSYSTGNVMLDQSLPLEGTTANLHALTAAYARSINLLGTSGRITAVLPLANGKWRADLSGVDTSTVRNGIGDPLIAIAVNFIGSPALRGPKFAKYKRTNIVGASLKVRIPIGQYNSSKFFNLGTGRWQVSPRLGIALLRGRWVFEGYASAWFFSTNNNFYGGNTLEQKPLLSLQLHAIYQFRAGFWGALSFGQGYGGETRVNGVDSDNIQTNNRAGVTLVFPVARVHALKAAFTSGVTTRAGADFDTFIIAWQYRWGGM